MGVLVDVLHCVGSLKDGLVDGHAVGGHNQRILVSGAVVCEAGGQSGGVDFALVGVVEQVSDVYHLALGAPVGNQTLGSFHNQVGGGVAFDSGVDLVVAIGVGQVLNGDLDAGSGLEAGHQLVNGFLVAPATDGVGPQGDFGSGSGCGGFGSSVGSSFGSGGSGSGSSGRLGGLHGAGTHRQHHDEGQCHSDQLFHHVSSCNDSNNDCLGPKAPGIECGEAGRNCFAVFPTTSRSILQQIFINVNKRLKKIFQKRLKMKIFSILHRKFLLNAAL